MNRHRDLIAWQKCRELASAIYRVTRSFPRDERFGLIAQLRRAAVSAAANIAEANARLGARELGHGLSMTLGSLAEVDTLLAIAEDLDYVSADELARLEAMRSEASMVTFGLQRRTRSLARK